MLENHKVFKTVIGGREVSVDVGKYAQQANGSCMVKCGDLLLPSIKLIHQECD